jgi:hypothetical protein
MTTPTTTRFTTALAVANNRRMFDLDHSPERWNPGPEFQGIDLRPGRIILIGAPPATGKTTLTLQLTTNVLERHSNLRCVLGNVETSPAALLEKLLARFSCVDLSAIQDRMILDEERARLDDAIRGRGELLGRLAFLEGPFTLAHLTRAMIAHEARLCIVDY